MKFVFLVLCNKGMKKENKIVATKSRWTHKKSVKYHDETKNCVRTKSDYGRHF